MPNVTRTTMTLAWLAPNKTGGCPILSYSIFKKNSTSALFDEVDAAKVNYLIELRSHVLTFNESETGNTYSFYL